MTDIELLTSIDSTLKIINSSLVMIVGIMVFTFLLHRFRQGGE